MANIKTYHWYSKAEIDQMMKSPDLASIQLKGYYLETDGSRFRFIHDRDSFGKRPNPLYNIPLQDDVPPIVKRTPAQRTDSLVQSIIKDCMAAGSVPGFSNEKMTELLGYSWVNGISIMTDTVARTIAAKFLAMAEAKRNEHESGFVVKPSNYK